MERGDRHSPYNISKPSKGLYTDTTPEEQPDGTYRFALNAIKESGEESFLSSEEGTSYVDVILEERGFRLHPIGQVYMGNGETALFLVTKRDRNNISVIGIFKDNDFVKHVVFDELNFDIEKQIDCVFRLRRSNERVIYFTDGINKPRQYNFDRDANYKTNNVYDVEKFNLIRSFRSRVPAFINFNIEESGTLLPGSYNFAIQYVDSNLNATEWIAASETIIIFNDSYSKRYEDIRGSTNLKNNYLNFSNTNKSISFNIINLTRTYAFYRIAIIESTSGTGQISKVLFSEEISTSQNLFIYSSNENGYQIGTIEEVQQFANVIDSAEHIEQIENRLILANVKYKNLDFSQLQEYASKIEAKLLNTSTSANRDKINNVGNVKRGTLHVEYMGYTPGEIYSFGIMYVFGDGTRTPVYHIPGLLNTNSEDSAIISGVDELLRMSNNNKLRNLTYANTIYGNNYWKRDSVQRPLGGREIRHHRFPFRHEIRDIGTREGQVNVVLGDINRIFGIQFNRIFKPNIDGIEIIGFDIVRNIREEHQKTILDTGILLPLVDYENASETQRWLVHGMLHYDKPDSPDEKKYEFSTQYFALVHPQHKFKNIEYRNTQELVLEGFNYFNPNHATKSTLIQDVVIGTSFDPAIHSGKDEDGIDLLLGSRVKSSIYFPLFNIPTGKKRVANVEEIFYLDALESKTVELTPGVDVPVINMSLDNKICIVKLDENYFDFNTSKKIPYVAMRRNLSRPYGNFRDLPYIRENKNTILFDEDDNVSSLPFPVIDSSPAPTPIIPITRFW